MLRLRSDEQLVALLRAGHEEAFQVIYDRYRARLSAYMRQMLSQRQDVEDALQEVFERAYTSLRYGDRDLALRPWLYRIAHNRCIDHLRRPVPPAPELMIQAGSSSADPILECDRRETLRRLMADVGRLPEQQRSALLMRELGGTSYAEVAAALGVTVPAVKSLLVRARIALVQAGEARETACEEIRAELVLAHEGRVRPNAMARRHLHDCPGCREFRGGLRGVRRQLLALAPGLGPIGVLARLLGTGGGSGGAAAACSGSAAGGAAGAGTGTGIAGVLSSAGALASSTTHMAALIAATVVTATGAAAIAHSATSPHQHRSDVHAAVASSAAPVQAGITGLAGVHSARTVAVRSAALPTGLPAAESLAPAPMTRREREAAALLASQALAPIPDPGAATHADWARNPDSVTASSSASGAVTTAGSTAGCTAAGTSGPGVMATTGSGGSGGSGASAGSGTDATGAGSGSSGSTGTSSGAGSGSTSATGSSTGGASATSSGPATSGASSGTGGSPSGTGSASTGSGAGTTASGSSGACASATGNAGAGSSSGSGGLTSASTPVASTSPSDDSSTSPTSTKGSGSQA